MGLVLFVLYSMLIEFSHAEGKAKEHSAGSSQVQTITEEALAKRLHFYQSFSQLKVNFKQVKILKDLKLKLHSEGRLQVIRPDQVIWEVIQPSKILVKLNQKVIEVTSGEGAGASTQKWKISDMPKEKDAKSLGSLIAWLQLDSHALSQQYQITSSRAQTFEFIPRDMSSSPFVKLNMTLAQGGHLKSLVIDETSGDEIQIDFGTPQLISKP